MKKLLSLLLVLAMLLGLAACSMQDAVSVLDLVLDSAESSGTPTEDDPVPLPVVADPAPESEPSPAPLPEPESEPEPEPEPAKLDENGSYTSKDDVALYIHTYGHLPSNFMPKKDAEALGWTGGSLEKYAPGKSIGGDSFGNFEGLLPKKSGRKYTECDIDTAGKSSRGAKRIVFSNDGLVYYTEDHYEHFELLYGEVS